MSCENYTKFRFQRVQIKVYWHAATPILFCLVHGCFPVATELNDCDGDRMASKAENVYIWPFPEKLC